MTLIQSLILAAGEGSRFRQAGYLLPKPLLPLGDKPIIVRVCEDLEKIGGVAPPVILARKEWAHLLPTSGWCFRVPALTQGAAETALLSAAMFDQDRPLIIANADQGFSLSAPQKEAFRSALVSGLNVILAMPAPEKNVQKWSYAITDDRGLVCKVVEKPQIAPSPHATIGVYAFARAGEAFGAIKAMVAADDRTNGEFYLAPCFNYLSSQTVVMRAASFTPLGTPEDYERAVDENFP